MARLLWLPSVLRKAGLKVIEYPSWSQRGRDSAFLPMKPKGVVAHHTATRATTSNAAVELLLANGRTDLPGPLCHLGLRRDGTFVVIASGIANHAGSGSWKGVTGNRHVIGIEAYNDGMGEPWSDVQLKAYDRGVAAILHYLKLPSWMLCGHKEWAPTRKIDPRGIDMVAMRLRVEALLRLEDLMNQLTDEEIEFLKSMIAGVLAVNSNPDFARVLILDFRERKANP